MDLSSYYTFTAEIDRISSRGNGIIHVDGKQMNIGPVTEDSVGEEIIATEIKNLFAVCHTESVRTPDYEEELISLLESEKGAKHAPPPDTIREILYSFEKSGTADMGKPEGTPELEIERLPDDSVEFLEPSETVSGEIIRFSSSGNGIVKAGDREINIGPVTEDALNETVDVRVVHSNLGECLEESVRTTEYETEWILKKLVEGTPPPGTEFLIKISHINNSGNGMADLGDRTINLGAIRQKAVGRTVPVKMINNTFAKCLDCSVRVSPYEFPSPMKEQYVPELGGVFFDVVDSIDDDGNGVIIAGRRQVNIGPVQPDSLGKRVQVEMIDNHLGKCLTTEIRATTYQEWLEKRGIETDIKETQGNNTVQQPESEKLDVKNRQPTESDSKPNSQATDRSESSTIDTKPVTSTKVSIENLRKKAEKAATEDPVRDTSKTVGSRYVRSPTIKEYVKARSEGFCEYCGNTAPFETSDGEPYLEVHHVDELGEGGVDHPDKVVALCPTCHKQVHHGRHAEEINQELRQRLQDGLADIGTKQGSKQE